MVNTGAAVELDEPNHEKIGRLYSKIAYSRGVYGINGDYSGTMKPGNYTLLLAAPRLCFTSYK